MYINKKLKAKNRKTPVSIQLNVTKNFETALNQYVKHISREKEKNLDKESVIVAVMENFLNDFQWQQENSKFNMGELLSLPDIP